MKKPFLRIDAALVGALVKLAQLVGLPADTAWEVLKERSFKDTVDADWAKSRKYGVTGIR